MLLMSQTEFAKRVGVTQQAISKLVKDGKLPVDEKNKLIMPDAEKKYYQLKGGVNFLSTEVKSDVVKPQVVAEGEEPITDPMTDLLVAKIRKERVLGKIHQQKYEENNRILLSVEEVSAQVVSVCENIRNTLINLPNKVAPLLEGLTAAEIQLKLDDEINEVLTDLYSLHREYSDEESTNTA